MRSHAAASEEKHAEGTGLQLRRAQLGRTRRRTTAPALAARRALHPIGTPRTGFLLPWAGSPSRRYRAAKAVHWTCAPARWTKWAANLSLKGRAEGRLRKNSAPTIAPAQNNPAQGERMRYPPSCARTARGRELALIPLVELLDAASESLISAGTVHIPAAERATFQKVPARAQPLHSLADPDPAR